MKCFVCNREFSETVKIRQRSVPIDVSLTEYSMMQMKTTDDMRKIHTLCPNCNRNCVTCLLSCQKKVQTVCMALKCRIMNFNAIVDVLFTPIVLKS